ncbi:MAG TPA: HAD family hydrolase [Streptosporangiaceae bacterium]|nr:HAD family hydrolase [Streptosporangiaceae bacterium]
MTGLLVSVDVGGTIGQVDGRSLTAVLAMASTLPPAEARRIIRQKLHTQPSIGSVVVADVCDSLGIPVSAFPRAVEPSPLRLVPGALTALRSMSQHATLVTLSNVTCLEADTDRLRDLLHPWVLAHFPSCRIGYAKPDPAAFRYVAQACHTSTRHMVHVGDDWICDVIGARSAGVTAIWVSKGRSVPEPARLSDHGVLIADDIAAASQQLTDLALRRRS